MTARTPGPWTLAPCSHGGKILRRGESLADHQQPFLQVLPVADAQLMAAAPDLLEALKIVRVSYFALAEIAGRTAGGTSDVNQWPAIVALDAAIAKAEGRLSSSPGGGAT